MGSEYRSHCQNVNIHTKVCYLIVIVCLPVNVRACVCVDCDMYVAGGETIQLSVRFHIILLMLSLQVTLVNGHEIIDSSFGRVTWSCKPTLVLIPPSYVMTLRLKDRAHNVSLFNMLNFRLNARAPVFGICHFELSFLHTLHITRRYHCFDIFISQRVIRVNISDVTYNQTNQPSHISITDVQLPVPLHCVTT